MYRMNKVLSDELVFNVAKRIGSKSTDVYELGFKLGFDKSTIDGYVSTNRQNGVVSTDGTREMLFDWKKEIRKSEQVHKLRKALLEAKMVELADDFFSEESPELLCLKCGRVTAQITNVINTKISEKAVHSKVRNIKGKECLVQLMKGFDNKTGALYGRYDTIAMTTADVKLSDEVRPSSVFDGYKEHRWTFCKGCSQQVGWYFIIPEDTQSEPFHALFLQRLIHDSYDPDNVLNSFFSKNR